MTVSYLDSFEKHSDKFLTDNTISAHYHDVCVFLSALEVICFSIPVPGGLIGYCEDRRFRQVFLWLSDLNYSISGRDMHKSSLQSMSHTTVWLEEKGSQ